MVFLTTMTNLIQPPASNLLLRSIYDAFQAKPDADGIHISIEPHAREIEQPDGGISFQKAVCWNLTKGGLDFDDDPSLELVDEEVTEDSLRADLETYFKGCRHLVDGDILIEEDPE